MHCHVASCPWFLLHGLHQKLSVPRIASELTMQGPNVQARCANRLRCTLGLLLHAETMQFEADSVMSCNALKFAQNRLILHYHCTEQADTALSAL